MCPVVKPMNLSPASAFTAPSPSSSSSWRRHWTRKQKRRAPAVRSNHLSSFESSHFIVETTRFHRPDFVCCFSPFSHLVPSRSTPPHPLPTPSHRLRFDFSRSNCLELVSFFWNPSPGSLNSSWMRIIHPKEEVEEADFFSFCVSVDLSAV